MILGRRIAGVLVAVVLGTALPADAAPRPGNWARLVSWLGAWSGLGPVLTSAFGRSDAGPLIDPNGGDGSWSTTGQGDAGPIIDPDGSNGSWPTAGQGDEGPLIDPNGGKG